LYFLRSLFPRVLCCGKCCPDVVKSAKTGLASDFAGFACPFCNGYSSLTRHRRTCYELISQDYPSSQEPCSPGSSRAFRNTTAPRVLAACFVCALLISSAEPGTVREDTGRRVVAVLSETARTRLPISGSSPTWVQSWRLLCSHSEGEEGLCG
jgi:hypothetical protein